MNPDILSFFNNESIEQIAADLNNCVSTFKDFVKLKPKEEKEKVGFLDYTYDLSKGKVVSTNANTWLAFDLKPETTANSFLKAMYSREMSEEEEKQLEVYIKQLSKCLINKHLDNISNVIRSAVLPDTDARTIPLKPIEILGIEIVDYSAVADANKRTIKLIKLPESPVNMRAVMSTLDEAKENNPGLSVADIIQDERLKANPLFDAVLGATTGDKYLWDVQLALFVDYSFSDTFLELQNK